MDTLARRPGQTATTRKSEYIREEVLFLAFELGNAQWRLGFTVGLGQPPRERTITAGDLEELLQEIKVAKGRFGLPEGCKVLSCYEAGRDGFWLHRFLAQAGIENLVVDSSSIQVNRRFRRAKTDRLDAGKLLTMLIHFQGGETKVWHVVHVPSVEAEDRRSLHRDLQSLKRERTHHINRLKGLLVGQGIHLEVGQGFVDQLDRIRLWDGSRLPPGLRARLAREHARWQFANQQIRGLEREQYENIRHSTSPEAEMVRKLLRLRGIGLNSAWLYTMEFFAWRQFHNRRELGALAGLTPTPHQSGDLSRELGISKAGNRHVRAVAIEIAWAWLHFQPDSQLSCWFQRRFGQGSSRMRRIGIVAVARKLLIDLWRYVETGTIPAGATLKTRSL